MNYNVKPFVHIDGLMSFSIHEKICLIFLLLSPFSIFIAHFSTYYISMMDVFIPFFAVLSTFFSAADYLIGIKRNMYFRISL